MLATFDACAYSWHQQSACTLAMVEGVQDDSSGVWSGSSWHDTRATSGKLHIQSGFEPAATY